ncbi:MAG: efflux RND transporter periplasmic adaptor subunit [Isosphaerales bacterium]
MPRAHLYLNNAAATGIVLMALAAGCERSPEGPAGPAVQPVRSVEIVHPERHTVRRSVGVPGELQAFETTPMHAKIAGYVKDWSVNIGAKVKKGQVLAELSVPELEAELKQKQAAVEQSVAKHEQTKAAVKLAEANIAGAEAKLKEVQAGIPRTEADLVRWQLEYKRVEELHAVKAQTGSLLDEDRSKLRSSEASRQEVLAQVNTANVGITQSHAALDQARSDVVAAASAIDVAKADSRNVEAMLGYTKIEAPFDGIVTQRNVNTGALTQPGADQPPLFIVARSDIVTIRVDVPEAFAVEVNPGDGAVVKLQEVKGKTLEAKVTRTSWAVDTKVRTLRVEIDIPNPGGKLLPGLYAYATVVAEEHKDVLTVPTTAVVNEKDKSYCVAVVEAKAVRRPIQLGLRDGTRTEIASGLDGGEAVVKANAASLTDGQPVQIEQPAAN